MQNHEQVCEVLGVSLKQLMAWEGDDHFMDSVLRNNGHWIAKRYVIMEALLRRASDPSAKDALVYAAAYLIAIGDPCGAQLAKLEV